MSMKIEEMREFNRRLTSLLDDPQPGLVGWAGCLHEVMEGLAKGWNGDKKSADALAVIGNTPHIRQYLLRKDPKALLQVDRALGIL